MRGNRAHSSNRLALHKPICSILHSFCSHSCVSKKDHIIEKITRFIILSLLIQVPPHSSSKALGAKTTIQLEPSWSSVFKENPCCKEDGLQMVWDYAGSCCLNETIPFMKTRGGEREDRWNHERKKKSGERESKHICFQSGERADPKYAFSGLHSSPELEEVDVHILP